jgi:hypothetical protein
MKNLKFLILPLLLAVTFIACEDSDNNEDLSIYVTPTVATVTTGAATNISAFAVKIPCNITSDGQATLTACGVVYSETANPTIAGSLTVCDTLKGAYVASVGGLKMLTKYYAKAYAINKHGVTYGNEISFTTTDVPDYSPFLGIAVETPGLAGGGSPIVNISLGTNPNELLLDVPVAESFVNVGVGTVYSGTHPVKIVVNPATMVVTATTQLWTDSFIDPKEMGPMSIAGTGLINFKTGVISIKWTVSGNAYWGDPYTINTAYTYKKK